MAKKNTSLKSLSSLRSIRSLLREIGQTACDLSDAIADLAEPPMKEFRSAQRLMEFLKAAGFCVTTPYRDMPTAFRAVAGRGRPTIAILAEYDALPDCGPRPGQWGHGCGHNLLGVASAAAGVAAAGALRQSGHAGQIVVLGCPAEEALGGKVYMAEQGAFRGLDAALGWHPGAETRINPLGGSAMDSILIRFTGRTSHAGGAPHLGRSALDGVILTDVAVNYLREHIEESSRVHCVITRGGKAPNVVPDQAAIWYYIRARSRQQVDELRRRLGLCARGAALATETTSRMVVQTSIAERIPNAVMAGLLQDVIARCGLPSFTDADDRAAARLIAHKKYSRSQDPPRDAPGRASSDEDNVSWFAPLGCVSVACIPRGVPGHHRDYAATVRLPAAHKGMLKAAEMLAMAAVELAVNGPLLAKAKAEFKRNRAGKKYDLPLGLKMLPAWG